MDYECVTWMEQGISYHTKHNILGIQFVVSCICLSQCHRSGLKAIQRRILGLKCECIKKNECWMLDSPPNDAIHLRSRSLLLRQCKRFSLQFSLLISDYSLHNIYLLASQLIVILIAFIGCATNTGQRAYISEEKSKQQKNYLTSLYSCFCENILKK